jgi:hypothetical protein
VIRILLGIVLSSAAFLNVIVVVEGALSDRTECDGIYSSLIGW